LDNSRIDQPDSRPLVDNELGQFPSHMSLVQNVFTFSHADASAVMMRFQNNADLLVALDQVIEVINASELPEAEKGAVTKLFRDEKAVISFSTTSRSSVVAI
jgi:multidrug efflux pump subunit AcrB